MVDARVIGNWTNASPQNSWAYMRRPDGTNIGWKRCKPGNADAVTNMTVLLTHAKTGGGRPVSYGEDSSGYISDVYVW